MTVNVSVNKLKKICDPFEDSPWGTAVTHAEVKLAIKAGRFREPNDYQNTKDHAGRIACLVVAGWCDPIEIDVGIPVLNYFPGWIITDGNHRLAAAIYLKQRYIRASVAGQVDYANKLLGVSLANEKGVMK